MEENINNIMQQTRRYWYEDGFAEIAIGLLFSLLGIGLYLQKVVADHLGWLLIVIFGLMIFIFSSSFLAKWLVTLLKQRITYPRTGYIEYDHKPDSKSRWAVVAFALGLAIMTLVIPDKFGGMGSIVGLLVGGIMAYLAYRSAIPRFTIAAVLAIAVGILATYLALDDIAGSALVFGVVGLTLFVSGTWVLITYLRHTQPPKGDI
jgi:membrane-anchored glycerophosphoryl diester phosphodiesterase (GDPDase)